MNRWFRVEMVVKNINGEKQAMMEMEISAADRSAAQLIAEQKANDIIHLPYKISINWVEEVL